MCPANPPQHEPKGASVHDGAAKVVVRAGKTFVCTACGTLVEIPPEVVGQLVLVNGARPPEQAVEPNEEAAEDTPPASASTPADRSTSASTETPGSTTVSSQPTKPAPSTVAQPRPPRPRRPKSPRKGHYAGRMVDGLRVPTAAELDHALAWVSFHLQVLDRQGSEIHRLQKELKRRQQQSSDCTASPIPQERSPVHASKSLNTLASKPKGREPP